MFTMYPLQQLPTMMVSLGMHAILVLSLVVISNSQDTPGEKLLEYELYEGARADTFIGDVSQDSQLSAEYDLAEMENFRYIILKQRSPYADYFTISDTTGELWTAQSIDRDVICPQKPSCSLSLVVAIEPREYFQIIQVKVHILDQNDNPPQFLESHTSRSIAENTPIGTGIPIPSAEDMDSPKYGVTRYELASRSSEFELRVTNNTIGSLDLQLVLKVRLDREQRDLYRVTIIAYDGGIPPASGTLTVDIIVLDVNDNNPVFNEQAYEVSVFENGPVNEPILTVEAHDADIGPNGEIVYGFTDKTAKAFGHLFGVHNTSGEIVMKGVLDYEESPVYNLGITARDKNPESLPAVAKVIVRVQDVNDHPPKITINAMTATGHVEISEGKEDGSFVAHMSVEDKDGGQNGQFNCSIHSQDFRLRKLYRTEFKLVTAGPLDRETLSQYQIAFVCEDHGRPALTSTSYISVTILDENDNAPQYLKQQYSAFLVENNLVGAYVVQVNATDPDLGQNAVVEYRPLGPAASFFDVDPVTGNITTKVSFDYEHGHKLQFTVVASDHGVPPKSSTATVLLTILDVDDEVPKFNQKDYMFGVYENQPQGTEVGQVTATDADSTPHNEFYYALDDLSECFDVEPTSGRILTRKPLDRELKREYTLTVRAVSQGEGATSSAVDVLVYIIDKNDNAPIILFPNERNNTVHIANDVKVGSKVALVQAIDKDSGINARLAYLISGGDKEGYFLLDDKTGEIQLREPLNEIEERSFSMTIEVRDSGVPRNATFALMNIVVNKSLSEQPLMSGKNLTIVVTVAVVSAILMIILTICIICMKRQDQNREKAKYVQNMVTVDNRLLMVDETKKQTHIGKKASKSKDINNSNSNNRKEVSFSSDIDMEGEKLGNTSQYPAPWASQSSSAVHLGKPQTHPYGSTSVHGQSHRAPKIQCRPVVHQLAMSSPRHSNNSSGEGAASLYQPQAGMEEELHVQVPSLSAVLAKDKDSDSTNSTGEMSNADSGRGSNEDADSRPSPIDQSHDDVHVAAHGAHSPRHPNSRNTESFKTRLNNVVQMQREHVADNMAGCHDVTDSRPERRSSAHHHPHNTGASNHRQNSDLQRQRNAPSSSKQPHGARTKSSKGGQHGKHPPGVYYITGSHADPAHSSSWAEDESGPDFSDEDKEYVYYVNASHV